MRTFLALVSILVFTHSTSLFGATAEKPSTQKEEKNPYVWFVPPAGWKFADATTLPPNAKLSPKIKVTVIGEGQHPVRPMMNLFTEPYSGTLKQYLKMVKSINDAHGNDWKDLGTIKTASGPGSLSQMDNKTEWGLVRVMHVILLRDGQIYILTASALKEEFSNFYKEFFASMKSLHISNDIFDTVISPEKQKVLKSAYQNVVNEWKTNLSQLHKDKPDVPLATLKEQLFSSEQFKTKSWNPFKEMVQQKFSDMGSEWHTAALQKLEKDLFEINL